MTEIQLLGGLLIAGVVLGLFVRIRTIGWIALGFVVASIAGCLISGGVDGTRVTFFTRMGGTAPVMALVFYVGGLIGAKLGRKTPAEKAAAESPIAAAPAKSKAARVVGYGILAIPALFVGNCVFNEVSQPRGLRALCETATGGRAVRAFMEDAAATSYHRRAGGPAGKNEDEWFDRQYLRIGKSLAESKNIRGDYSVVFAKPGIGYYACIVVHDGGVIDSAWFEDHSG